MKRKTDRPRLTLREWVALNFSLCPRFLQRELRSETHREKIRKLPLGWLLGWWD